MSRTYAVVLDFEATCDDDDPPRPQEVIEFPSVLLQPGVGVLDTFETFVRPVVHPTLTPFCTELTSIVQSDVQSARCFAEVFQAHQAWMASHGLHPDNAVIVTCGDWDLQRMLPSQLRTAGVANVPRLYTRWLNIKVPFKQQFHGRRAGMKGMLSALGLPLLGRHHRGIDDCHNIARILAALLGDGANLAPTAEWTLKAWPPLPLVLRHEQHDESIELAHRSIDTLKGLANRWLKQKVRGFEVDGRDLLPQELPDLPARSVVTVLL